MTAAVARLMVRGQVVQGLLRHADPLGERAGAVDAHEGAFAAEVVAARRGTGRSGRN